MCESRIADAPLDRAQPLRGTVLIVEDHALTRESLAQGLVKHGFETVAVSDPAAARPILHSDAGRFAAAILDLHFANETAETLLDHLRALNPAIAVIIASGFRDEQMAMRCLQKGASDFIKKPFRLGEIAILLERAIRRKIANPVEHDDLQATHPTTDWVELTAPSDFEFLARMQRFSQILFNTRLATQVAEDLRMCMEEMGRNAIEWGNRFDKEKQFRISYCFFKDRVILKFEDEGDGFDPKSLVDPSSDPRRHLATREEAGKRPGGFGVLLVHNIMDEVVYSERGNVVLMTKFL